MHQISSRCSIRIDLFSLSLVCLFHFMLIFLLFQSQNDYSEQWALACGEILRILTHYNRPVYKAEPKIETDRSTSGKHATSSDSTDKVCGSSSPGQQERKPIRPLSPWITDILLAAPLGVRSDYFRWLVSSLCYGPRDKNIF